jgi:ABC-type Fe3+ transport system substrate-binding protein
MSSSPQASAVGEETASLDELYQQALAEGGELVVYAGGDTQDQQSFTVEAFGAQFPDMRLTMVVDYSKFHDVRIDSQLAEGTLVPDVVQLQTLQDFDRWKRERKLLPYKPAGFSQVHDSFKDPDGTWTAINVYAFSTTVNAALPADEAPATPPDLLDLRWKGQIASSYPQDDDAVLFLFTKYVQAYGWEWVDRFATQDVRFARGTHTPGLAVATGEKPIGVGGAGSLTTPMIPGTRWTVPDGHPFVAWGQRAAILNDARHPAAAKLYLNWQLSTGPQEASYNGWSVREDVTPPGGLKPVWEYSNAYVEEFPAFMADRAQVEWWRYSFVLRLGEVTGAPSPGWLGSHPGR